MQVLMYFSNTCFRGAASQAYDGNTIYETMLFLLNDIRTYVFRPHLHQKVDPDFNKSKAHVCTWTFQRQSTRKNISNTKKNPITVLKNKKHL